MTIAETTVSKEMEADNILDTDSLEKSDGNHTENEQPTPDSTTLYNAVSNDNGIFLNDMALESEVVSFINEYRNKEYSDIERPAVVLSQLRALYNSYSAKLERSHCITKGVMTKYGIQRGMLLNIEKRLLEVSGQEWLEHFAREYGQKRLRTAQDYMKLANTPNILHYAIIGKERLMGILRAVRFLGIESDDPIATLFEQCSITFNPEDCQDENEMVDLKLKIDKTIALSKIRKAEEEKDVELGVNLDHIDNLIKSGVSVNGEFINDLFELNNEGRDVNNHIAELCGDGGSGDELLPHIKQTAELPKIVDRLKTTVETLRQNDALINRVNQESIDHLEQYVSDLKQLFENHNAN